MKKVGNTIKHEFKQNLKYLFHLKEFYGTLAGFMFIQLVAYFLANQAGKHSNFGSIVVRSIFFAIQTLLMIIFDNKMHWFQIKNVALF